MSVFANRWRDLATLLAGSYLFFSPWIFGASPDEPSSANTGIAGLLAIMAALWALIESPGPRTRELTRIGIGVWLLASPFVLGFAGTGIAYNAWITGVLLVALTDTRNLDFDPRSWLRAKRLSHRVRAISPESIINYEDTGNAEDPELLSRQIAERACEIYRTLHRQPSEIEAEMCARGYRACMDDLITLVSLVDKELPEATFLRRLRLKAARERATRSLSRIREALPQELRHSSLHGNGIT